MDERKTLSIAKKVIDVEIAGLEEVRDKLGAEFIAAVRACSETLQEGGKLVFTGVGKSGHISKKIAATLMSTGSPAAFLHPVEAMHGDLGMLGEKDLIVAVSYSGESREMLDLLPAVKHLGHKVMAVTGGVESRLAKKSDYVLPMKVAKEAGPFGLAPTTSTTALLALGDALAICLMVEAAFTKKSYGMLHPAGAIGKSLTYKAADVMQKFSAPPEVKQSRLSVSEAVAALLKSHATVVVVVDGKGKQCGAIESSDVLTAFSKGASDAQLGSMVVRPLVVFEDILAIDVLSQMNADGKDMAVVIDGYGKTVGLVRREDLSGLKV